MIPFAAGWPRNYGTEWKLTDWASKNNADASPQLQRTSIRHAVRKWGADVAACTKMRRMELNRFDRL
jgi:hypothetical protein